MSLAVGLLAIAAYIGAVGMHNRRRTRPVAGHRIAFFVAGTGLAAVVLAPPIDALCDGSFAAHMAQHLILMMLAAPLVLLGAPLRLALTALPARFARHPARALQHPVLQAFASPLSGWLAFVVALWALHFSALYEFGLENEAVHIAEHVALFGAALLFWYPIAGDGLAARPLGHGARILYLVLAMPQSAFLGLAIYQARHPLYAHYLKATDPFGASALADQRGAGELMWIAGSIVMFAALLFVVADWSRADAKLAARIDARLKPAP